MSQSCTKDTNPIPVFLLGDSVYPLPPFEMVVKIHDKKPAAKTCLVHVSQIWIHLAHWKPVLNACNVWILIYIY